MDEENDLYNEYGEGFYDTLDEEKDFFTEDTYDKVLDADKELSSYYSKGLNFGKSINGQCLNKYELDDLLLGKDDLEF